MDKSLNFEFNKFFLKHSVRKKYYTQSGGAIETIKEIDFNDYTFIVHENVTKNEVKISIMPNPNNCGAIYIDKNERIGSLLTLFANKNCAIQGISDEHVGRIQMNFILHYLRLNKNRLKIDKLQLSDISSIKCNHKTIPLADLYMMTHGDTWYGTFGFKPTRDITLSMYKQNKKIMKTASAEKLLHIFPNIDKNNLAKNVLNEISKKDCLIIHKYFTNILHALNIFPISDNSFELTL